MKQVLQDLKAGATYLEEVPVPMSQSGEVLIQNTYSLISAGTEKMLMNFGKANLLQKARQQPDKVKQVLDKVKTDGLLPTLEAVRSKLNEPLPLGYSCVGRVLESGGTDFKPGQRVISNGHHAEVVRVANNLVAAVPDEVSDQEAAFTVVASIGLQGVRLLQPTLGESVVVTGLGLIGLITAQLLKANGCRVLGLDFAADKVAKARELGIEALQVSAEVDVVSHAVGFSGKEGVDGVIITAATQSNEPLSQAASMCRKRGRIVLVGVIGPELSRADFYEKELSFQVSCSYGPGRYDNNYEKKGQDYPLGFVRWTEQRNFEAVLALMASGKLNIKGLISQVYAIEQAEQAYASLDQPDTLGVLLGYSAELDIAQARTVSLKSEGACSAAPEQVNVAVIGAGNYAGRVLNPAFVKAGAHMNTIVSSAGLSGTLKGKDQGFEQASTDYQKVLDDSEVNTVVIATRHDQHASQVIQALEAKKHVFVEKPLGLTLIELAQIEASYHKHDQMLMVGFNRRFAPHTQKMKQLLETQSQPKTLIMTVNAGSIPGEHWTQDKSIGGGRIVGEACHFVDLMRFLTGASIKDVSVLCSDTEEKDNVSISLSFADGSIGTIHYLSSGHGGFAKERLEVFCNGKVLQLDNFRKLKGFGWKGFSKMNLWRQDKGQQACTQAFVDGITNGQSAPVAFEELMEISRVTVEIAERVWES